MEPAALGKRNTDLESLELIDGEVMNRNFEHDLSPVSGLGLDTERELVVDDGDKVSGHLQHITSRLVFYYVIFTQYSIHRAICRPSDCPMERPRADIRTRDRRI